MLDVFVFDDQTECTSPLLLELSSSSAVARFLGRRPISDPIAPAEWQRRQAMCIPFKFVLLAGISIRRQGP